MVPLDIVVVKESASRRFLQAHLRKCVNSLASRGERCVWTNFGAPLQGLIFSKSRVRGYGRLGAQFLDHRQLTLNHVLNLPIT